MSSPVNTTQGGGNGNASNNVRTMGLPNLFSARDSSSRQPNTIINPSFAPQSSTKTNMSSPRTVTFALQESTTEGGAIGLSRNTNGAKASPRLSPSRGIGKAKTHPDPDWRLRRGPASTDDDPAFLPLGTTNNNQLCQLSPAEISWGSQLLLSSLAYFESNCLSKAHLAVLEAYLSHCEDIANTVLCGELVGLRDELALELSRLILLEVEKVVESTAVECIPSRSEGKWNINIGNKSRYNSNNSSSNNGKVERVETGSLWTLSRGESLFPLLGDQREIKSCEGVEMFGDAKETIKKEASEEEPPLQVRLPFHSSVITSLLYSTTKHSDGKDIAADNGEVKSCIYENRPDREGGANVSDQGGVCERSRVKPIDCRKKRRANEFELLIRRLEKLRCSPDIHGEEKDQMSSGSKNNWAGLGSCVGALRSSLRLPSVCSTDGESKCTHPILSSLNIDRSDNSPHEFPILGDFVHSILPLDLLSIESERYEKGESRGASQHTTIKSHKRGRLILLRSLLADAQSSTHPAANATSSSSVPSPSSLPSSVSTTTPHQTLLPSALKSSASTISQQLTKGLSSSFAMVVTKDLSKILDRRHYFLLELDTEDEDFTQKEYEDLLALSRRGGRGEKWDFASPFCQYHHHKQQPFMNNKSTAVAGEENDTKSNKTETNDDRDRERKGVKEKEGEEKEIRDAADGFHAFVAQMSSSPVIRYFGTSTGRKNYRKRELRMHTTFGKMMRDVAAEMADRENDVFDRSNDDNVKKTKKNDQSLLRFCGLFRESCRLLRAVDEAITDHVLGMCDPLGMGYMGTVDDDDDDDDKNETNQIHRVSNSGRAPWLCEGSPFSPLANFIEKHVTCEFRRAIITAYGDLLQVFMGPESCERNIFGGSTDISSSNENCEEEELDVFGTSSASLNKKGASSLNPSLRGSPDRKSQCPNTIFSRKGLWTDVLQSHGVAQEYIGLFETVLRQQSNVRDSTQTHAGEEDGSTPTQQSDEYANKQRSSNSDSEIPSTPPHERCVSSLIQKKICPTHRNNQQQRSLSSSSLSSNAHSFLTSFNLVSMIPPHLGHFGTRRLVLALGVGLEGDDDFDKNWKENGSFSLEGKTTNDADGVLESEFTRYPRWFAGSAAADFLARNLALRRDRYEWKARAHRLRHRFPLTYSYTPTLTTQQEGVSTAVSSSTTTDSDPARDFTSANRLSPSFTSSSYTDARKQSEDKMEYEKEEEAIHLASAGDLINLMRPNAFVAAEMRALPIHWTDEAVDAEYLEHALESQTPQLGHSSSKMRIHSVAQRLTATIRRRQQNKDSLRKVSQLQTLSNHSKNMMTPTEWTCTYRATRHSPSSSSSSYLPPTVANLARILTPPVITSAGRQAHTHQLYLPSKERSEDEIKDQKREKQKTKKDPALSEVISHDEREDITGNSPPFATRVSSGSGNMSASSSATATASASSATTAPTEDIASVIDKLALSVDAQKLSSECPAHFSRCPPSTTSASSPSLPILQRAATDAIASNISYFRTRVQRISTEVIRYSIRAGTCYIIPTTLMSQISVVKESAAVSAHYFVSEKAAAVRRRREEQRLIHQQQQIQLNKIDEIEGKYSDCSNHAKGPEHVELSADCSTTAAATAGDTTRPAGEVFTVIERKNPRDINLTSSPLHVCSSSSASSDSTSTAVGSSMVLKYRDDIIDALQEAHHLDEEENEDEGFAYNTNINRNKRSSHKTGDVRSPNNTHSSRNTNSSAHILIENVRIPVGPFIGADDDEENSATTNNDSLPWSVNGNALPAHPSARRFGVKVALLCLTAYGRLPQQTPLHLLPTKAEHFIKAANEDGVGGGLTLNGFSNNSGNGGGIAEDGNGIKSNGAQQRSANTPEARFVASGAGLHGLTGGVTITREEAFYLSDRLGFQASYARRRLFESHPFAPTGPSTPCDMPLYLALSSRSRTIVKVRSFSSTSHKNHSSGVRKTPIEGEEEDEGKGSKTEAERSSAQKGKKSETDAAAAAAAAPSAMHAADGGTDTGTGGDSGEESGSQDGVDPLTNTQKDASAEKSTTKKRKKGKKGKGKHKKTHGNDEFDEGAHDENNENGMSTGSLDPDPTSPSGFCEYTFPNNTVRQEALRREIVRNGQRASLTLALRVLHLAEFLGFGQAIRFFSLYIASTFMMSKPLEELLEIFDVTPRPYPDVYAATGLGEQQQQHKKKSASSSPSSSSPSPALSSVLTSAPPSETIPSIMRAGYWRPTRGVTFHCTSQGKVTARAPASPLAAGLFRSPPRGVGTDDSNIPTHASASSGGLTTNATVVAASSSVTRNQTSAPHANINASAATCLVANNHNIDVDDENKNTLFPLNPASQHSYRSVGGFYPSLSAAHPLSSVGLVPMPGACVGGIAGPAAYLVQYLSQSPSAFPFSAVLREEADINPFFDPSPLSNFYFSHTESSPSYLQSTSRSSSSFTPVPPFASAPVHFKKGGAEWEIANFLQNAINQNKSTRHEHRKETSGGQQIKRMGARRGKDRQRRDSEEHHNNNNNNNNNSGNDDNKNNNMEGETKRKPKIINDDSESEEENQKDIQRALHVHVPLSPEVEEEESFFGPMRRSASSPQTSSPREPAYRLFTRVEVEKTTKPAREAAATATAKQEIDDGVNSKISLRTAQSLRESSVTLTQIKSGDFARAQDLHVSQLGDETIKREKEETEAKFAANSTTDHPAPSVHRLDGLSRVPRRRRVPSPPPSRFTPETEQLRAYEYAWGKAAEGASTAAAVAR